MPDNLVGLKEMALLLGVHPETLRKAHLCGDVRSYKIGNNVLRFDPEEVRADLRMKRESEKSVFGVCMHRHKQGCICSACEGAGCRA